MEAVPTDEAVHGVKASVKEKSHPKVEIPHIAVSGIQFTAGFFPQTPASERRFLLNVFVGAGQEAVARLAGQSANIYGHAVRIKAGGPAREPFHGAQGCENAADYK